MGDEAGVAVAKGYSLLPLAHRAASDTVVAVLPCKYKDACPMFYAKNYTTYNTTEPPCAPGHTGLLCGLCKPYYYSANSPCRACTETIIGNMAPLAVFGAIVVVILVFAGRCKDREQAKSAKKAKGAGEGFRGRSLDLNPLYETLAEQHHTEDKETFSDLGLTIDGFSAWLPFTEA